MGVKKDITDSMSRQFKLLLYPDNEQHVHALDIIQQSYPEYLGIRHIGQDGTKDHWHILLVMGDNPIRVGTLCRKLGLLNDDLSPDTQFIRLVGGRRSGFLVYLTHLSEPDKEQYIFDDLFGSAALKDEYLKAELKFKKKQFDMQDCVIAVLDWLKWQEGVVRLSYFARWICDTPYFKCANSPLVRGLIQEHNDRIFNAARKVYLNSISDSAEKMQAKLSYPETFEELPSLDPDEFEPLY